MAGEYDDYRRAVDDARRSGERRSVLKDTLFGLAVFGIIVAVVVFSALLTGNDAGTPREQLDKIRENEGIDFICDYIQDHMTDGEIVEYFLLED